MASSSSSTHCFRYDVFVSFRGQDTRNSFTSHLLKALDGKKVVAYMDYKLENGVEIAPALLKAIEESRISVIIFSENYASSPWCLDELVHILECKEKYQQFVIPVFYRVSPSHVRYQRKSYAAAFAKHEAGGDKMDEVLKWKSALTIAANLSGFDSDTISNESELVEGILKAILMKLDRQSSSDLKGLVGVESRIQKIESLICNSPPQVQVRTVGIWGMGGIGKTTLAGAVYSRLSSHFEASCFLANVREESEKCGINHLRNELLRELLKEQSLSIGTPFLGSTFVNKRLSRAKIFIVLDDVSDLNQLEYLVGVQVQFGPGSRIIITTRDKQLLREMQVLRKGADHDVKVYEVQKLNCNEALQLFHMNASQRFNLGADSAVFLRAVVDYAAGIPLALQIWGSLFRRCKSQQERDCLLNKLRKFPNQKLLNVYRVSYDALDENEREIFLNIACFHKEEAIDDARRQLDACGLFADSGIKTLIDMSLIQIKNKYGNRNFLWMHDVIQEMGWAIVHEQCPEEPGKRSRLWNLDDVCHVLGRNTGTEKVHSISVNLSKIKELNLRTPDFTKMYNLRFLRFYRRYHVKQCNVRLNLKSLPSSLRYLCWPAYPLKSLPPKFSSENLVEISMPNSQLQRLWNEGQNPRNLKRIDLRDCKQLVEVPDLSKSVNIETIDLPGCLQLVEVPSYFKVLHKLGSLNLSHCLNLKILSDMPHNMRFLNLDSTAVEELPTSIFSLEKLVELNLECCEGIKNLPNSSWKLNSLTSLYLCGTSIEGLPLSIDCLSSVASIQLKFCKRLVSLPTSIYKLKSLERLSLEGCSSFRNFPEILEPMKRLEDLSLSLTEIKELPYSIENLVGLKTLRLYECKSLESLPSSIYKLNLTIFALDGCCRLKRMPPSSAILWSSIRGLDLHGCLALKEIPDCIYSLTSIWRLDLSESMIESISPAIKQASGLRFLYVSNCKCLQFLPELPYLLKVFDASGCTKLETVSRSMTVPTEGLDEICESGLLDHHEQHLFYDCLNLDENARSNIVDDAHLRIMRTATANHRLSLLKKFQSEGSAFQEENSPSVAVVCPGNELPKWLSYQTEGSSIQINLPLTWCPDANFLGIALCAVVTIHKPCWLDYGFKFTFKTVKGENHQFDRCARTYEKVRTGWGDQESDHLFVWYDRLEKVWTTDFNNATEAFFDLFVQNRRPAGGEQSAVGYCSVKRCGICLLSDAQMLLNVKSIKM
ncbi:hypothetical protein ACLB2K_046037 [Fragaria x ananassa]